ncbi:prp pol polyprotein-like [Vairimorpha necatrix]|uniref:Prp pol polyprotein-like n=1 Tax=Vairimorpha necatrix TaxID=6039 RepID=A0AAX4JC52_9MICR
MKHNQQRIKETDRTTTGDRPGLNNKNINYKLNFNKSILETYFRVGYINLSSKDENPKEYDKKKKEQQFNTKSLTFSMKIEGLEDKLSQEIKIIEDIDSLDILKWCQEIETLIEVNKWDKRIQLAILRQLIKDDKLMDYNKYETWNEIKEYLISVKFPLEERRYYRRKLLNIHQTNYTKIQEYYDAIKQNLTIVRTMEKLMDEEVDRLFEEAFHAGLGKFTYGRVLEYGFGSYQASFEFLKGLEIKISIRAKEIREFRSINSNDNRPMHNNHSEFKKDKYCKLHKYSNHTTEECTKYDKDFYKRNNDNKDNRNVYFIKENVHNFEKTQLRGSINETPIDIMIDSGANKSFMSAEIADKLKIKTQETDEISLIFGNGAKGKTNKKARVEIRLAGLNKVTYEDVHILKNLPEKMILGSDFLLNNGWLLDYKNKRIIVNNAILPMIGAEEIETDEIDAILYDRILLIKEPKILNETNIPRRLTEYIKKNEEHDKIKVEPLSLYIDEKIRDHRLELKYYTVPVKYEADARKEISRLLTNDIIERGRNYYASPSFFIEKKNKELRLVVDYRTVNKFIKDEICIIPKIYESLYKLGGNTYYSKIDLKNGFNQLELEEGSRDITSFTIFGEQYRYKRIPFGIKSGPKLFQKTINYILHGIKNIIVYIDDIVIYGSTPEEHNEKLLEVLNRLMDYRVKINFEKSMFATKRLEILGNVIENDRIRIDTKNIDNLLNEESIPCRKKDIQKIMGIITWYRNFLTDVSRRVSYISRLLKNDCKEKWGDAQNLALKEIKEEIKTTAQLRLPDFSKKFSIQCDASNNGMGAVLFQERGVIGYYSRKFSQSELNYTIVEKEMFAIVKTLEFYRTLIQGYKIEIQTDSRNCIFKNKEFLKEPNDGN